MFGHFLKDVAKVSKRVQSILFGRLHDAVYDCAGVGSTRRVREQPVAPPDHERSDGAFTAIVADLQPAIFQERR